MTIGSRLNSSRVGSRHSRLLALVISVAIGQACAAIQPTDPSGPRANQPIYPALIEIDPERQETTLAAIKQVLPENLQSAQIKLNPVTGTIQSGTMNWPFLLPKIGTEAVMNEEETREALRRFLAERQNIIGAEPDQLSLIEHVDQPDGTKLARYEQRPFRFPLRGEFGKLEIRFAADRRIISIDSTCIPDAARIQPTLAAITPKLTPEDAVKYITENAITYVDSNGQQQSIRPVASSANARELVFYVLPSTSQNNSLEFHLAWAIDLTDAPIKTVYLDALESRIIATG
jgi:hypothetical protein